MKSKSRSLWSGKKAYYGKPIQLFGDKDRDGVMNVFDCKPHNKRRQDVMMPLSGGSPMNDMHYRQEISRQQNAYKRQLAEYYKDLESQGLKTPTESTIGSSGGISYVPEAYIPDASGNWVSANSTAGKNVMREYKAQIAQKTLDTKRVISKKIVNTPPVQTTAKSTKSASVSIGIIPTIIKSFFKK